jgi:hypothetical protein
MLSYHDLKLNSRVLRAFTSLDPEEFERLLIPFEKAWQDHIPPNSVVGRCRRTLIAA